MVNNLIDLTNSKTQKVNSRKSDMNFLKEKITEVGISQKDLASKLRKNVVTINRWVNEEREISVENAIEIAKILNCDPAAILFPPKKLNVLLLRCYTDDSFMVKDLTKKYYTQIVIPNGYYTKTTLAVKFYKIGSHLHNEIYLFERVSADNGYEGFHEDSIGKVCYLEPNAKMAKEGCTPIVAIVKINESTPNYTLDLLHPRTMKPFNVKSIGVNPDWIKVSAPKKMSFFEKYNYNI